MPSSASWLLQLLLAIMAASISLSFPYYDEDEYDMVKRMLAQSQMRGDELSKDALDEYFYRMQAMKDQGIGFRGQGKTEPGVMKLEMDWPAEYVTSKLGQVGGVAVCAEGHAHVFHRASRIWEDDMFDKDNVYSKKADGPIKEYTMLKMHKLDGKTIDKTSFEWSRNRFYLPHGLTLDHEKNYWLTDVAMHQVFKFSPGASEPSLVLGKAFEPATSDKDTERFCMPTDVAVASNGQFFVADGYCNSRVVKYSANGTVVGVVDDEVFSVPHSLALVEEQDLLCVADRENERILCLRAGLKDETVFGQRIIEFDEFNLGRVYSIAYSPKDRVLYAVSQASYGMQQPMCYTINMDEDRLVPDLMSQWAPQQGEFDDPHAVAVSPDGNTVYVGIIDQESQQKVWKFYKPGTLQPQEM